MKMYRESFKRLAVIGLPLAFITLLYTVIVGGQDCFGLYTRSVSTSAIGMVPVLVYYVFTAIGFALYGYSYLFKRSSSDVYHSLPVKRMDLYLSNLLATATWMGSTIVLNVVVIWLMQLFSGTPFVPAYVPLAIAFFFIASMLVYAAAAIGCALSGTLLTAVISTGIVLLFPRFIQFIIARGLVAKVAIVGWLDLGALLNPVSNIATGMIVMQTRNFFTFHIVSIRYILFSLVLTLLELGLGAWFFVRRPSETADKGSGHKVWVLITASLLAMTTLLLITIDAKQFVSVYGMAITAIAFLVFIVYQVIASRNMKQILLSLPCFALVGALAFGVSLAINQVSTDALSIEPTPSEIASIHFRGHDQVEGLEEYTTTLLPTIEYTSDSMKKYVSENLSDAVESIKDPDENAYYEYQQYQVIEPIALKLTDGRMVYRTIEFSNSQTLNDLRSEDTAFVAAIRALPADSNTQEINVDSTFTKEETLAIWDSYVSESQSLGLITNDYYRKPVNTQDINGYSYNRGGEQVFSNMSVFGYTGMQRFGDYHTLRMETPETISLLMRTYNQYMKADTTTRLWENIKHIASPLALENDSINLDLNFYNVPMIAGEPASKSVSLYLSGYNKANSVSAQSYIDLAERFVTILQRGTPTDDPSGMFVDLTWFEYDSTNRDSAREPDAYLSFNPEDEQTLVSLISEWETLSLNGY